MPSIDDNFKKWGDPDNWERGGDEWSDSWGTSHAVWYGSILKRVAQWIPTGHLLELAPGHGRVTEYLLPQCRTYTGVDVSPLCIEKCKERFANVEHASFHVGDGKSLPQVEADSVDFAFSWDSLVHADHVALRGYLSELATKLKPGAMGFLHHSNLGAFVDAEGELTVTNLNWRDPTTSAATIREFCRDLGLQCLAQELVQWGYDYLGDCFTVLRRPASVAEFDPNAVPRVWENPSMNLEIGYCKLVDEHYQTPE